MKVLAASVKPGIKYVQIGELTFLYNRVVSYSCSDEDTVRFRVSRLYRYYILQMRLSIDRILRSNYTTIPLYEDKDVSSIYMLIKQLRGYDHPQIARIIVKRYLSKESTVAELGTAQHPVVTSGGAVGGIKHSF